MKKALLLPAFFAACLFAAVPAHAYPAGTHSEGGGGHASGTHAFPSHSGWDMDPDSPDAPPQPKAEQHPCAEADGKTDCSAPDQGDAR